MTYKTPFFAYKTPFFAYKTPFFAYKTPFLKLVTIWITVRCDLLQIDKYIQIHKFVLPKWRLGIH